MHTPTSHGNPDLWFQTLFCVSPEPHGELLLTYGHPVFLSPCRVSSSRTEQVFHSSLLSSECSLQHRHECETTHCGLRGFFQFRHTRVPGRSAVVTTNNPNLEFPVTLEWWFPEPCLNAFIGNQLSLVTAQDRPYNLSCLSCCLSP
jgi:hypothetical protein